jgi:lipopolysaccharide assembly protein A
MTTKASEAVMRVIRLLIAIVCIALGAILGALNRQSAIIDLGGARISTTLGVALLVALLLGVMLGGLAIAASVVLPLRRRLADIERERIAPASNTGT